METSSPTRRTRQQLTQQLVTVCFGPAPVKAELPSQGEGWDELIELALYHGVAPMLWTNLEVRADLPESVRGRLAALYASNLTRNLALKREQETVRAALADQAILSHGLKGTYLAETIYGDLGARQASDIDILIPPQNLNSADRILRDRGYQPVVQNRLEDFRRSKEMLYQKEGAAGIQIPLDLDLHFGLLPYRQHDPLLEWVWARGMTQENLLVYLCANQVAHRFARLKYVLDILLLVGQAGPALDWDVVVSKARELELAPGIGHSLEGVRKLTGVPVPGEVLSALRPGWFDRTAMARAVGGDLIQTLARGPALAGPFGAASYLACTRGFLPRFRVLRQLLFPPVVDVRCSYPQHSHRTGAFLYGYRLVRKFPPAAWGFVKSLF